jgi:hypothetical protein
MLRILLLTTFLACAIAVTAWWTVVLPMASKISPPAPEPTPPPNAGIMPVPIPTNLICAPLDACLLDRARIYKDLETVATAVEAGPLEPIPAFVRTNDCTVDTAACQRDVTQWKDVIKEIDTLTK